MTYLSASQVSCLQRCEREYLFKYVLKLQEEKSEPLYFGSAFDKLVDAPEEIDSFDLEGLSEHEYPYRAVLKKMVEHANRTTAHLPKVKVTQFPIETGAVKGYIDAVRVDDSGDWMLAERKTAGRVEEEKRLMLHNDIQVATYVAHADLVAKELGLDLKRFKGLSYETTQKPTERLKKSETLGEFAARATVATYVWAVPESLKAHCTNIFYTTFSAAKKRKEEIEKTYFNSGNIFCIPGTSAQCFRYGSKCSFFNQCHGLQENPGE